MPPDPPSPDGPTRALPGPPPPDATTVASPAPVRPEGEPDLPAGCGRYEAVSFHKGGGMGRVFVARDTELNRHVALKDIRPEHAGHPALVRLFLFEAEVTGALEHPGVVPVYGLGRGPDGRPYYAMRFIDGESLADAIRDFHARAADDPYPTTERAVGFRRLLTRFLAVCQTVAFAHSRGVLHRDLKPANVMLGPFGETLVVDWGLALQVRADDAAARSAMDGARVGSPPYWAPEQARGDTAAHDERTDVYGLGATLFEIVTGAAPHPDGKHGRDAPAVRGAGGVMLDSDLEEIIASALRPNPADRPASAGELALAVERWLADQPVSAQRAIVRAIEAEAERFPDRADLHDQLARQRANLGLMYVGLGRPLRACRAFTLAARWYEGRIADGASGPRDRAELANCKLHLARSFDLLGLPAQAAESRALAAKIYDGLMATDPDEFRANIASIIATHTEAAAAEEPAADASGDVTHGGTGTAAGSRAEPLLQGYTVLRPLGQGALGRVFLARDNALSRLVAIKDFRADLPDAARRRAVRELRVSARLVHPNVIRVYTYGTHAADGRPFMVMEYLPGHTLRDEIRAFHQVPGRRLSATDPGAARLLGAVAQACEGIHFAHTQGIVHRDPKPANVMVREDGRAVVVDWGLAKVIGTVEEEDRGSGGEGRGDADPAITAVGALIGTPAYLAPERAAGTRPDDPGYSADVYSLGAGLYEALTGALPYPGTTAAEMVRDLLVGKPRRPSTVAPGLPSELEAICAVAMAFRPADRYPTAAAIADDLRAYLAGKPVSVRHRGRLRKLWDQLAGR